mgnify:CR=1 FL=1
MLTQQTIIIISDINKPIQFADQEVKRRCIKAVGILMVMARFHTQKRLWFQILAKCSKKVILMILEDNG